MKNQKEINSNIRERAKIIAEKISSLFGSNGKEPKIIANHLGIDVYYVEMEDGILGALKKESGKDAVIYINENEKLERQRMTLAHELGHYILRFNSNVDDNEFSFVDYRNHNSVSNDLEEIFADEFADNLLIPEEEIKELYKEKVSPIEMAIKFNVSGDAITRRMRNLGLKKTDVKEILGE